MSAGGGNTAGPPRTGWLAVTSHHVWLVLLSTRTPFLFYSQLYFNSHSHFHSHLLSSRPHSGPVTQSRLHSSRSGDKVASTRSHPETVVPVALAIDQANKMDAIAEIAGEELAQNPHQVRMAGR